MSELIRREMEDAKRFMLEKIEGTELVKLNQRNVALVEAMIQNDSAYLRSSDKEAKPKNKYNGSIAYWMSELKMVLIEGNEVSKERYEEIIEQTVNAVDRENSTHLNADKVGREEIKNRILHIEKKKLVECLRDKDNLDVFKELERITSGGRRNPSFASKFCHYACFYLFEGKEEQDNYSIYDTVLKTVLPKYIKHYKLEKYNLQEYREYRICVDRLIEVSGAEISRNGFDHLLWYYFKGRI